MPTFRDKSRNEYDGSQGSIDIINVGSLQRIADATEKMSANITALMAERDKFAKLYRDEQGARRIGENWRDERAYKLERRVASLKGVITRMKKRSNVSC